jgi:hypothetical protein
MHESVRHISVTIARTPEAVYSFASDPANLPKWATGLSGSIENVGGEWFAESPLGRAKVRFAEKNPFGVLDHDVILESGRTFHIPMRVVPRGDGGSELILSLFRQPEMTDEKFSEDAAWVLKDLNALKALLEKAAE